MKRLIGLMILGIGLQAGTQLPGIWLGDDVSFGARNAVVIGSDGVVTVWIGAKIPGLEDLEGKPVYVKRVVMKRSKE